MHTEHPEQLVKSRTIKWLTGVILQSNRILENSKTQLNNDAGCDTHFFAIALANTLYWLKKTKDKKTIPYHQEISKYEEELSQGKDLRDMLEHDGNYIIGKGRKQKEYRRTKKVNNGKLEVKGIPPFTLMVTNEGHLIGGRVSVEKALELSVNLLNAINKT